MKNMKKQTWRRKGASLGILIFIISGNGMLFAKKEKPGAILVVQKLDGQAVKGELLEVKDGTLNLLSQENALKVDIRIDEISGVRIEKKSALLTGLGIGILAGAASGALIGFISGDDKPTNYWESLTSLSAGQKALAFGFFLGLIGGAAGGTVGALKGVDKSITFTGSSPEKLRRIEAKLASLARFKPDPIAEFRKRSLKEPE
jgi:hypothetical protein